MHELAVGHWITMFESEELRHGIARRFSGALVSMTELEFKFTYLIPAVQFYFHCILANSHSS